MKHFLFLFVMTTGLSCTGQKSNSDSGTDPIIVEKITVSGTVEVFPDAKNALIDAGTNLPSLEGLLARVEEPLKVAQNENDPTAVFGTTTLDSTLSFSSVVNHPADTVVLGIAVGIREPADAGTTRVVKTATGIYDRTLQGAAPLTDIKNTKAYAVPAAFHEMLTQALGSIKIQANGCTKTTLIECGFILGKIVDAQGAGLTGATLSITRGDPSLVNGIFYLNQDMTGTQASTASHGLFVYTHNGGSVNSFDLAVKDNAAYFSRNSGALKGAGLLLRFSPGK